MKIIEAKNLKKSFKKGKREIPVLKGVDITVEKGEFISIMGPSGVGKSTLLHILGLLDSPTEGELLFLNQEVPESEEEKAALRNRHIGFVFQQYYLLPEFTALENVMMPILIGGNAVNEAEEKAKELLKLVGLEERMNHKPGELSGGEQQRVAIARALVKDPVLLIADEPTGNLDKETARKIMELIKKISLEKEIAVVMATHDEEAAAFATKILRMRDGRITESPTEKE